MSIGYKFSWVTTFECYVTKPCRSLADQGEASKCTRITEMNEKARAMQPQEIKVTKATMHHDTINTLHAL